VGALDGAVALAAGDGEERGGVVRRHRRAARW
jgi:hypothetical protein